MQAKAMLFAALFLPQIVTSYPPSTGGSFNGDVTGEFKLSGEISPAQLTADQDDWNPTGVSTASVIRVDGDASMRTITSLAGGSTGRQIEIRNVGANTLLIADDAEALGTAANRFDFGSDPRRVPLWPKSALRFVYDSTLSRWILVSELNYEPPTRRHGFRMMGRGNSATTAGGDVSNLLVSQTGTGASCTFVDGPLDEIAFPGAEVDCDTGSGATGRGGLLSGNLIIARLGNGAYWTFRAVFRLEAISDGTNTFTIRAGFLDVAGGAPVDGVYTQYSHGENSGAFTFRSMANSSATTANGATAVAAATYYEVLITCAPSGASCSLWINNVLETTAITTNIPTAAGRGLGWGIRIEKSVGTTELSIFLKDIEVAVYRPTP